MAVFMIDLSPNNEKSKKPFDSTLIVETLIKMRNIIVASKTVGDHDLMAIGSKKLQSFDWSKKWDSCVEGVKDMEVSFWTEITELSPKYFVIWSFLL